MKQRSVGQFLVDSQVLLRDCSDIGAVPMRVRRNAGSILGRGCVWGGLGLLFYWGIGFGVVEAQSRHEFSPKFTSKCRLPHFFLGLKVAKTLRLLP